MEIVKDDKEYEQAPKETNVIRLRMISSLPLDPDQLLEAAMGELDAVVILGWRHGDPQNRTAGDEYFASSIADGATVVWLLERCKRQLLQIADEDWQPGDVIEPA